MSIRFAPVAGTDSCPWIDFAPSEQVGHVLLEIRLIRKRNRPLGFVFHGLPPGSVSYVLGHYYPSDRNVN